MKNLCEICESKEAKFTCKICKRHVCEGDYNKEKQICKVCEMTLCQICKKNLSLGYCEKCGRLICDECTGYFDGAKRICKECLRIISSTSEA